MRSVLTNYGTIAYGIDNKRRRWWTPIEARAGFDACKAPATVRRPLARPRPFLNVLLRAGHLASGTCQTGADTAQ